MKRALAILAWILSWGFPAWLILGPGKDPIRWFVMPFIATACVMSWTAMARRGRWLALSTERRKEPFFLRVVLWIFVVSFVVAMGCLLFDHELIARAIFAPPYILWWITLSIWDVPDVWRWAKFDGHFVSSPIGRLPY